MNIQTELNEPIEIPKKARTRSISEFKLSTRLGNILAWADLRTLGQLHGLTYGQLARYRGCGSNTLKEIKRLVEGVLPPGAKREVPPAPLEPENTPLHIPTDANEFTLTDVPTSIRLRNVMASAGIARIGDLADRRLAEFRVLPNCGDQTIAEITALVERLWAGHFKPAPAAFSIANVPELLRLLDEGIAALPPSSREMLLMHIGAASGTVISLGAIGRKFKLTGERVRQVIVNSLQKLRSTSGPRVNSYLKWVARICKENALPFTADLLAEWMVPGRSAHRYPAEIYARLMAELEPEISACRPPSIGPVRRLQIGSIVRVLLAKTDSELPVATAWDHLNERMGRNAPGAAQFIEILNQAAGIEVDCSNCDVPVVRLRHMTAIRAAMTVLAFADGPMTLKQITAAARQHFRNRNPNWSSRIFPNSIVRNKGIYLLGRGTYGLKKHFRLTPGLWRKVQNDAYALMNKENKPISTVDLTQRYGFEWAAQTTKQELACILREDKRFTNLGKFLFGLSHWRVKRPVLVKDVICRILRQSGAPLTRNQLLDRIRRVRSVSRNGMLSVLRQHSLVQADAQGLYRLRSAAPQA